jgi:hypothetical protein
MTSIRWGILTVILLMILVVAVAVIQLPDKEEEIQFITLGKTEMGLEEVCETATCQAYDFHKYNDTGKKCYCYFKDNLKTPAVSKDYNYGDWLK